MNARERRMEQKSDREQRLQLALEEAFNALPTAPLSHCLRCVSNFRGACSRVNRKFDHHINECHSFWGKYGKIEHSENTRFAE